MKNHCAPQTNENDEKKPSILVVDDEPGFLDFLSWELTDQGFDVETAADGLRALDLVRRQRFEVIVSDLTMPAMDGLGLLQSVKESSPATQMIIVTGFGAVETAVEAMRGGACDFVLKPYDFLYLLERIKCALRRSACGRCGRT